MALGNSPHPRRLKNNPMINTVWTKFTYLSLSLCLLAGCSQSDPREAEQGEIVISELMPRWQQADPQWLELYNSAEDAINLRGCEISNNQQQSFAITSDLVVESQSYLVIPSDNANQPSMPQAIRDASLTFESDAFELATSGQISLSCGTLLIDQLAYQVSPPSVAATARSWQLHPDAISASENDRADNWCTPLLVEQQMYGDRRFGSPGRENLTCTSSMPYVSFDDQTPVLIEGIDWDATLQVAEAEFARELSTSELPIWGIRDQIITPQIAARISVLYFDNIEMLYDTEPFTLLDWNHAVWHFAWAIANLYRNGDSAVRQELQLAYEDALTRPETLGRYTHIAIDHIRNDVVVMGDIHTPAHSRMQQLIVAPGNPDYLQSYQDYVDNRRSALTRKFIHSLYIAKTWLEDIF